VADDGRVLLITGGGSGIGAATARRAVEAGLRVVLTGRRAGPVQALADELGGPARALAVVADVREWDGNVAAVAAAREAFGRLDVAFANAGIHGADGWLSDTPERWREMVLTNVLGPALTLRAALPALIESGGHAVVMSSAAGRRVLPSLYSVTRWATAAMGEAVRQDVGGQGVRVTVVEPGGVNTPLWDEANPGRLDPDDVARAVLYAISQPPHVDVNEILIRPAGAP
jgi:NADP-dependent 3-hydroxy acid dehydrogenase YdfG